MKRGENWMTRLMDGMELSSEPLPGVPVVEVYGYRRVLIENHMGVCQYGQNEIRVKVSYGQVSIQGNCLELAKMTREQVVICGCVESIRLCRKGR